MIAEIVGTKRRVLVLLCVVLSLVVHLTPLRMRLHSLQFFIADRSDAEQVHHSNPPIAIMHTIKPLMMTKQLPRKMVQSISDTMPQVPARVLINQPIAREPEHPVILQQPISERVPEQSVPSSTHKIVRAGTGLDAPMTDFAITPALAKPGVNAKKLASQYVESVAERITEPESFGEDRAPVMDPAQGVYAESIDERAMVEESNRAEAGADLVIRSRQSRVRRAVLERVDGEGDIVRVSQTTAHSAPSLRDNFGVRSREHERAPRDNSGLDFLSQQNFERMMREQVAVGDDGVVGTEAGYEGAFRGTSAISSQYGEPRYLHYNSKIYRALQQSMDVVMSGINPAYYRTVLDGVTHPTGVRFSLDKEGQIKFIHVARSSGNVRYDILATKIVQEASFPSIPKSFGFHTTYHNYNILLYDVGPGPHANIGVASYLEGE